MFKLQDPRKPILKLDSFLSIPIREIHPKKLVGAACEYWTESALMGMGNGC
jgi:hypothetical protein